jgi:gamma-glutamyl:cysteine ligase YbdK (ATP-grasp superfamily)
MKNLVADGRRQFIYLAAAVPAWGGMLFGYASKRLAHLGPLGARCRVRDPCGRDDPT